MKYHPGFFEDFESLSTAQRTRVLEALSLVRADPFIGKPMEHVTIYKYRVYDMSDTLNVRIEGETYDTHLRLFYQIKKGNIVVLSVGKRKHHDAYIKAARRLGRIKRAKR